jgi:hypothetical protein
MKFLLASLTLGSTLAFVSAAAPAHAADAPVHLRGTVVSTTATRLTVKTSDGETTVALTPKTGYAGAMTGSMADIKPGTFLGIASVEHGKASTALEVTVFPDSMRGTGEGDYPWDLKAGAGHSMMTNGNVSHSMMTNGSVGHSMMTNGAVHSMMGHGTTVMMTYKGGSRTIEIPPNAPIVTIAPGSKALLEPGAHVFVIAANGTAGFVVVGEHGAIPPM